MRPSLPLLLSMLLMLNSCATFLGLHDWGEVPKKPGKYPEFTREDYLVGKLDEQRAAYDVTSYQLDIAIDPERKFITGEVTIFFVIVNNTDKIRIDLYENLDISSITLEGTPLAFTRNDRAVYVGLGKMAMHGDSYAIKVSYSGNPVEARKPPWVGGLVWEKDKSGNPWLGVTCETEGASVWFPCKDHPSDEPDSVRTRITVPGGLQVVSNGILKEHTASGNQETFTWMTHYPVNAYNITFYAGKFSNFTDTVVTKYGPVILDYQVLTPNLEKAKEHFSQTADVINIYSDAYGPYPWINEVFRLVEAPYEGMEHQTAIAYGSGYRNMSFLGGDYIIVHEAAHEWWGNSVTVGDFSDIWIQEGFATYSEVLFVERMLGYEKSLQYVSFWLGAMVKNKRPVVGPRDVAYWDHKDNDVYHKGALVLHTIRNIVGDSTLFFDILQTFYRENAFKPDVTTDDFIEVVERKTGSEWDIFFEAYLKRREVPVLKWFYGLYEPDQLGQSMLGNRVPFIVAKWEDVPEGFSMPVTITCADGSASARITVTTKAQLIFIDDQISCNSVSCNRKYSYIRPVYDENILLEIKDQ